MDTHCHTCNAPMTVEMEPDEFFTAERIAALATCDRCCRARGDRRPKSELVTPPAEKNQPKLPYADL